MSVVAIGVNHRTAPLELLERMSVNERALPKALHDLVTRPNVSEAVVLSTCNRTEVYAVAERFHGAYADIRDFLAELSYLPPEGFADHLYVDFDDAAVSHLFEVTAGLDSAVVGEHEILGQVRGAWEQALQEGTAGPQLNMLFRHAIEVGKRARSETGIGRHTASVSTAAVAMAADRLGSLDGRSALVIGAGDMGAGMVHALIDAGVTNVRVANRTWDRAVELAERVGGLAARLADVERLLERVDLLLTSTGATSIMVEHAELERVVRNRARPNGGDPPPLLIVDVAVPRDVDPSAAELPGVTLLDMEDLRAFADAGVEQRQGEVASVRSMVADEVDRYAAVASAREVAPLVADLHQRAEQVRTGEIDRFAAKLEGLDPRQRDAVEALTRGIVAKLLHDPTVSLKDAAGSAKGERLADAVRDLFDLS